MAPLAGRNHRPGAQIVFGLLRPLPAGTVISVGGPQAPSNSGHVKASPQWVIAVLRAPAWLFYQDLAPFQQYAHVGRLALVDADTGRVSLSRTVAWPPLIGGALPAFLANRQAYDSARYRVLYRPYVGHRAGKVTPRAAVRAARLDPRALDPSLAPLVADLLATQHACTISFTDAVAGGYYGFAWVAQSRAALDHRFAQLGHFAPAFHWSIYPAGSGLSPAQFTSRLISRQGCKDVLLYLAGAGYSPQSAINVGMGTRAGQVLHQDVTLAQLRAWSARGAGSSSSS